MNIVLSTDENFVQHCCVTMTSVLKHNTNVTFYIFTEGLSGKSSSLMKSLVTSLGGKIDFCKIDNRIVSKFPMPSNADAHISIATYYRLLAEFVLPDSLNKFIYMDCDMVVRGSLEPLWNEAIENYAIGAVFQPVTDTQEEDKSRLQIEECFGYFNAGLLIVNLDYWRKNDVTNRLLSYIEHHFSQIKQHDQDVLNAVLYREVKPISYVWNYLPPFFNMGKLVFKDYIGYEDEGKDPIVIHYVSAPKPWDYGCSHPYRKVYYQYLEDTPFRGYKPIFIWKKYYRNVLRMKLFNTLVKMDIFGVRKLLK